MSESKDKETYKVELKRRKGSVIYDAEKDQIDFEGKKFTGEFLRLVNEFKTEEQKQKELYAAMLKVPMSGTVWLDEMIEASRRDEFAKVAMEGLLVHLRNYEPLGSSPPSFKVISKMSLDYADALLAASNKRKEGD